MVLCNSQREEGLVPSQICRTSNRVIPQNYKINLEPIFNFLRLFYWIIVEKTSMSRSAGKTFFTSVQVSQKLFFIMLLLANSSTSRNTLFPYLNLCPTWVQVKLRVLTIGPVSKLGTGQRAGTVPLANLARSYFYSRRVVGKLYGNFRPTWSKEILYRCRKMTSSQIETKSFHIIFILCYPVIAGRCLINDMIEYKCAFSQENFSVVAFWQELI